MAAPAKSASRPITERIGRFLKEVRRAAESSVAKSKGIDHLYNSRDCDSSYSIGVY